MNSYRHFHLYKALIGPEDQTRLIGICLNSLKRYKSAQDKSGVDSNRLQLTCTNENT